jgi:hypothetical protein
MRTAHWTIKHTSQILPQKKYAHFLLHSNAENAFISPHSQI